MQTIGRSLVLQGSVPTSGGQWHWEGRPGVDTVWTLSVGGTVQFTGVRANKLSWGCTAVPPVTIASRCRARPIVVLRSIQR
jgi:hypothetical protein